jgi:hypothetical protein
MATTGETVEVTSDLLTAGDSALQRYAIPP